MRIGIYGGTFDPIHLGHLLLAETCSESARLDRVILIPAGLPPHKQDRELTPGSQRADMLEFAVAGIPEYTVSRLEIERKGPSYTVETLRTMRQDNPGDELFLLMGADSLAEFSTWREPREIAELATLLVVNRGDRQPPALQTLIPILGAEAVTRIQVISMPAIDISASELRQRVRLGQSLRWRTPRAVEQYIIEHALYREKGNLLN